MPQTRPLRVLQLYYKLPFPANDGGAFAIYQSSLALISQGIELKILAMDLLKSQEENNTPPENFISYTKFESIPVDNRIRPVKALLNLFGNTSYFIERFDSTMYRDRLNKILSEKEYDIVQLEHLYLGVYLDTIRQYPKIKVVLRAQNIENQLWQSYVQRLKNPFTKLFLSIATKRLRKFEDKLSGLVDGILALSEKDASYFESKRCRCKIEVVPIGLDIKKYPVKKQDLSSPIFYHLGSMDWKPNILGMKWFLKVIWPQLKKECPSIRFVIAGKRMPKWFFKKADQNLEVYGKIESSLSFQDDKSVLIVPLLIGSGIRVKILEAMALGKTIISTSVGASGIAYEDGKNILIADDFASFSKYIKMCIDSPEFRKTIGQNACQLIHDKYSLQKTGEDMKKFYECLKT